MKLLLDTDIGTDIDDAVCLAYLLCRPECDLLGITTVTGQPELRARLASVVCTRAGRTVPIFPGLSEPLQIEQRQRIAEQAEVLGDWPHTVDFPQDEAIAFMRETIRQHPDEVTLLAIGPLTNVGRLLLEDPEVAELLAGVVLMGGVYGDPPKGYGQVEWNIGGDPHAARVVFEAPLRSIRAVGLDATHRVDMSAESFQQTFLSGLFEPIQDMARIWFRHLAGTTFHDPLAAATLFEPSLCRFERGIVSVEVGDADSTGRTHFTAAEHSRTEVAVDVDPEAFFDHFLRTVS